MPKADSHHTRNPSKLEVIQGGGKPVPRRKPRVPQLTAIEGSREKELDTQALEAELSPDFWAPTRLVIREMFNSMAANNGDVPDAFFDDWRNRTDRVRQFIRNPEAGLKTGGAN